MSRFYVGQRVRIVGAFLSKHLIGTETTIRRVAADLIDQDGSFVGIGYETTAININGRYFCAQAHQLEPLTDPGREVMSWADERCAWKPEHLRERV